MVESLGTPFSIRMSLTNPVARGPCKECSERSAQTFAQTFAQTGIRNSSTLGWAAIIKLE